MSRAGGKSGRGLFRALLLSSAALWFPPSLPCRAEATAGSAPLAVHFLEVGQGDAAVITTPGGRCVLIDAGGGRKGGAAVLRFLSERGIRRIDTVVMSHADSDHIGGMPAILDSGIAIGEFLDPAFPHTTGLYRKVLESVRKREGTRYRVPKAGDRLDWGKELSARVVSPSGKPRSTNDSSIVIQLAYGRVSFLFTGDAGRSAEKQMVARYGKGLRAQVLKVGHHGSKSSSTMPFLLSVKPEAAVVSTSCRDADGPYEETIGRLREAGARVYQTGRYGMVTALSDGKGFRILTERDPGRGEAQAREAPSCTAAAPLPRQAPAPSPR